MLKPLYILRIQVNASAADHPQPPPVRQYRIPLFLYWLFPIDSVILLPEITDKIKGTAETCMQTKQELIPNAMETLMNGSSAQAISAEEIARISSWTFLMPLPPSRKPAWGSLPAILPSLRKIRAPDMRRREDYKEP